MKRNQALWITIGFLIIISLACNAFSGPLEPIPSPPTAVVDSQPTLTPTFVPTATIALNEMPAQALVEVLVDLNVRNGPGVNYDRIGFLLEGDSAVLTGVHAPSGWWQITCPESIDSPQCWVSGGEQYTRVGEVAGIPEVEAPPTPVPDRLGTSTGELIIVYIDDGRLFQSNLDLTQSPPASAGTPFLLSDNDNVEALAISPDGMWVAFIAGGFRENSLHIVHIEDREEKELVASTSLPTSDDSQATDDALLISQMEWLPDSSAIGFNTSKVFLTAPGVISREDFWLAALDGDVIEIFPAGSAGGDFTIISNETLYQSQAAALTLADLENGSSVEVLQYPPINTASEYVYYPKPQLGTAEYDFVAIPDADPWQSGAETTLWRITETRTAELLGSITDVSLLNPVVWSPDGQHISYIQQAVDLDDPLISRLFIAAQDGSAPLPYGGGERVTFHRWDSLSEKFLYSGTGFVAVGKKNAPPQHFILPLDQVINEARWVSEEAFIVAAGSLETGVWQLNMFDMSGAMEQVATIEASNPAFDTWLPEK